MSSDVTGIPFILFAITGALTFIDPSVKRFRSLDNFSSLEDQHLIPACKDAEPLGITTVAAALIRE